jgi:NADH dehydrogenase (ubiquinone) Fe-S protein 4
LSKKHTITKTATTAAAASTAIPSTSSESLSSKVVTVVEERPNQLSEIHSATSDQPVQISTRELYQLTPAYVTSGAPESLITKRRVRIFKPARTAMQSGENERAMWQLDFDGEQKWENPMMGWASSHDPVQALRMRFQSADSAVKFAVRQGWDYVLQQDQTPLFRKQNYAENYKYVSAPLRFVKTK